MNQKLRKVWRYGGLLCIATLMLYIIKISTWREFAFYNLGYILAILLMAHLEFSSGRKW